MHDTPVSDMGNGKYHLAARAEHGAEGLDMDRAKGSHLAEKYCRKTGQSAKIESFDQNGPFAVSPSVGVVFTCQQRSSEVTPHHDSE